jgi:hypothetical protein
MDANDHSSLKNIDGSNSNVIVCLTLPINMNAEYPDTFELIQTLIKKVLHNAAHNEIVLQTVLFVQITIRQR